MKISALVSYLALMLAVSAPLSGLSKRECVPRRFSFRASASFSAALVSTLALPWSGAAPLSYLGFFERAGSPSCLWFPFAALAFFFHEDSGMPRGIWRLLVIFLNMAAVVSALEVFVSNEGIPGGIPGIEGMSAILVVSDRSDIRLVTAMVMFFVSLAMSYSQAYFPDDRGRLIFQNQRGRTKLTEMKPGWSRSMLDFSYCSFLAIVFFPTARILLFVVKPPLLLAADFAAKFVIAVSISYFMIRPLGRVYATSGRTDLITPICFTVAGIYFLYY
ncbi:MAG: hypothetical protein LBQ58_01825 [Synergistaceae bacterium]|nr:hypothetical protein [Synergistaceae bacterium]